MMAFVRVMMMFAHTWYLNPVDRISTTGYSPYRGKKTLAISIFDGCTAAIDMRIAHDRTNAATVET
jgi:hypothetical protein